MIAMANIESPKDAEGREIPRNTEVMYDANGKKVHITSFTYKCDVHGLWSQWKVFSPDIRGEKDGMLPADSLYLTPHDSWERLEDDLDRAVETGGAGDESFFQSMACAYMNRGGEMCGDCKFWNKYVRDCTKQMLEDVVSRIRKLRGDD